MTRHTNAPEVGSRALRTHVAANDVNFGRSIHDSNTMS